MDNLLEEEQEAVLASLSQLLPGLSSQETFLNPEEVEKVKNEGKMTRIGDEERKCNKRSNPSRRKKNSCPFTSTKRKRGRAKKKSTMVKKLSGTGKEENDSGFGTSSDVLKYTVPTREVTQLSDSEESVTSLESVSLLQSANRAAMEVDDVSEGVKLAWNVKIFPALDDDEDDRKTTEDKAVQTGNLPYNADGSVMQTVRFISSVIRLKQIFTSRTNITRKEFETILKRLPEETESQPYEESSDDSDEMEVAGEDGMSFIAVKRRKDMVSCDTVRYVMRSTNAEDVTEKSVDAILVWLKEETEKDWRTVCCCWNGSITSEAVDIINEAVDSDVIGTRKKVLDFLGGILNEIHNGEPEQDTLQEFKVAFLSNFCKSILLQYDLINYVCKQLPGVISCDWVHPQQEISTAKKTYFTIRLLIDLLRSFLTALNTDRIEEIFRVRPKHEDEGVLNMWKTNWKRDNVISEDTISHHSKYLQVIRGWCRVTDTILNFSLKECPLLSLVAQRCSSLSREVLSKMETFSEGKNRSVMGKSKSFMLSTKNL